MTGGRRSVAIHGGLSPKLWMTVELDSIGHVYIWNRGRSFPIPYRLLACSSGSAVRLRQTVRYLPASVLQ